MQYKRLLKRKKSETEACFEVWSRQLAINSQLGMIGCQTSRNRVCAQFSIIRRGLSEYNKNNDSNTVWFTLLTIKRNSSAGAVSKAILIEPWIGECLSNIAACATQAKKRPFNLLLREFNIKDQIKLKECWRLSEKNIQKKLLEFVAMFCLMGDKFLWMNVHSLKFLWIFFYEFLQNFVNCHKLLLIFSNNF